MSVLLDTNVFFAAIYQGHAAHDLSRAWLDRVKPEGWGIATETFLAAIRLLMNPAILGRQVLSGALAYDVVHTELAGPHPGSLVYARNPPDPALFRQAAGHRQVMDFWLVQIARDHSLKLATRDRGLLNTWPNDTQSIR